MKIKKLISLFLAFTLSITSTVNCFAGRSNSGSNSEYDSDDSFSDIVVPELLVSKDDLERQLTNMDKSIQEMQQLLEQFRQSDVQIAELKADYAKRKKELDKLHKMLLDAISERDDAKLRFKITKDLIGKYKNDMINKNNGSDSILNSKKFYEGTAVGAGVVAIAAIGVGLCTHLLHARSHQKQLIKNK